MLLQPKPRDLLKKAEEQVIILLFLSSFFLYLSVLNFLYRFLNKIVDVSASIFFFTFTFSEEERLKGKKIDRVIEKQDYERLYKP